MIYLISNLKTNILSIKKQESVISYYFFFLHFLFTFFFFILTILHYWNKKNETMDSSTMHFYVMISVFLSSHIYQNSSKKRNDRTSYLVI